MTDRVRKPSDTDENVERVQTMNLMVIGTIIALAGGWVMMNIDGIVGIVIGLVGSSIILKGRQETDKM